MKNPPILTFPPNGERKNKFKIILFFLLFSLFYYQAQAEECNYKAEIDKCNAAVKDGSTRNITEFVCINDQNAEKRAYQIVLDKRFKEVDNIGREFLDSLEQNKDYYFGEKKKKDVNESIDDIEKLFWEYWDLWWRYKVLCDSQIIKETIVCLGWNTSVIHSKDFLQDDKWDCMWLVWTKLDIYKNVAYDVLKLNKQQVRFDSRKTFVQKERGFYDKLSDLFSINLWYLERIWKKTNTMTKNQYK